MLTRVPLDVVVLIIRHAVDRNAYDEDWPVYQRRLSQLCLVCRFFRDAVQPVLWTTLRVRTLEQFHKVAGREGRNRHLVKHVEEFRGGPELTEERMDDAMIYLRHYLPSLQAISLSAFGLHEMGLERFLRFDNLRSLSLHKYNRLHPMPAGSILPSLETLSLARTAALLSTFCNILRPECTPRLRHLALTLVSVDDTFRRFPPPPDLSRLRVVQVEGCSRAPSLYHLINFEPGTLVSFAWSTTSLTLGRALDTLGGKPDFLHLNELPEYTASRPAPPAYTELGDHVKYFLRAGILKHVKAVFLPSKLVNTDSFNDSTCRGAILSLLRACRDNKTPIVLYNADRDVSGELSTALLRHIERMDDSVYSQRVHAQTAKLVQEWEEYDAQMAHLPTTLSNMSRPTPTFCDKRPSNGDPFALLYPAQATSRRPLRSNTTTLRCTACLRRTSRSRGRKRRRWYS
ncbi:hypothetical protein AAT19DRAFT_14390 [Rhodotorula toruloides]|uniref:F-box domain-containing protein n=1 Tax=Rhodotorula toruloides TaxID=5286 RepID=A0A2T0ABI0_RHOTO|nr:hypothetical protein AAT19DRAFT_14390 [Rhodotorula toruloides]